MASEDPNRKDTALPPASPDAIEAAVARLSGSDAPPTAAERTAEAETLAPDTDADTSESRPATKKGKREAGAAAPPRTPRAETSTPPAAPVSAGHGGSEPIEARTSAAPPAAGTHDTGKPETRHAAAAKSAAMPAAATHAVATPDTHPSEPAKSEPAKSEPAKSEPSRVPPPESEAARPVRREGPSPWLALPIGAIAGALAAGAVSYGLLETGVLKPVQSAGLEPLAQRVAALEQRQDPAVADLRARVAQLDADRGALGTLQTGVSGLQTELGAVKQSLAALTASAGQSATLAQQAAGLADQIDGLSKKLESLSASSAAFDRAAAGVVTLGALREAIQAGRPFTGELDAARRALATGGAPLDGLAARAAQGFPAPALLADRLAALAKAEGPAAAAPPGASAPASGGNGLMDRLLSSAESLVTVRGTGSTPTRADETGIDTAAARLRAGDSAGALAALDALSPETKAKVQPVAAEIGARRDAVATVATLYQQALAAISGKLP